MVRRSTPDAIGSRRLKAAFVVLVSASGGLVAIQGDASPFVVALAVLGGVFAGLALLWYLRWIV